MFIKLDIIVHLALSCNWLVFKLSSVFSLIFLEQILRKQMFSLKPLKDYQHNFPSERKTQRLATNFKAMKHVSTHRTMPLFKKNILFPSHSFLYCVFRYLLNRGSTSIINETAAYSNWNEPNRQKSYVPLQLRPIRKLRAIRKLRRINNVIFPPFPLIYCFP